MRHQDDVDALGVDTGSGEILQGAAGRTLGRLQGGDPVAAVDQDRLLPVLMSCGLNGTVTMPFGI
jgi:hypothetical protein